MLGWAFNVVAREATVAQQVAQLQMAVQGNQAKLDTMRPASDLVSKDQFVEFQSDVHQDLTEIRVQIEGLRKDLAHRRAYAAPSKPDTAAKVDAVEKHQ
jgi:hypothetical protein